MIGSTTTTAVLSLLGWALIPDLLTKQLLNLLHRLAATRLYLTPPPVNSPTYRRHYAYTFATVVLGYLFYNLIQSALVLPPNFYQILGVDPTVDENGLKIAFRQFVKKNHPDRPEVGVKGEPLFIMVRDVFEALKDPVKRLAYDRFGPITLTWTDCSDNRDYLFRGLTDASLYHGAVGLGLVFWSLISKSNKSSFWRWALYAATFAAEICLLMAPSTFSVTSFTDPSDPFQYPSYSPFTRTTHLSILHSLFPRRVTFQHVIFIQQLCIFLTVALSRVAPQLFPDDSIIPPGLLERMQALTAVAHRETSIMLHTELHSILPVPTSRRSSPNSTPRVDGGKLPPAPHDVSFARMRPLAAPHPVMETLFQEMEELIIEANIKKDVGPLRTAWEGAVKRGWAALRGEKDGGSNGNGKMRREKNFWETSDDEREAKPQNLEMDVPHSFSTSSVVLVDREEEETLVDSEKASLDGGEASAGNDLDLS